MNEPNDHGPDWYQDGSDWLDRHYARMDERDDKPSTLIERQHRDNSHATGRECVIDDTASPETKAMDIFWRKYQKRLKQEGEGGS